MEEFIAGLKQQLYHLLEYEQQDEDNENNEYDEEEQLQQPRKPIDYYKEAVRLYYYNCVLYNHFEKIVSERNELKSKLLKFQALEGEYLQQDSDHLIQELEEKRKRNRRGASEIQRNFICSVENCRKAYGSEGSLMQHMKIKHGQIIDQFRFQQSQHELSK